MKAELPAEVDEEGGEIRDIELLECGVKDVEAGEALDGSLGSGGWSGALEVSDESLQHSTALRGQLPRQDAHELKIDGAAVDIGW